MKFNTGAVVTWDITEPFFYELMTMSIIPDNMEYDVKYIVTLVINNDKLLLTKADRHCTDVFQCPVELFKVCKNNK